MAPLTSPIKALYEFFVAQQNTSPTGTTLLAVSLLLSLVLLFPFYNSWLGRNNPSSPPSLRDPIPFIFNTAQFLLNNDKFIKRAIKAIDPNIGILQFHLGTKRTYLITEPKHIQTIFSRGSNLGISSDPVILSSTFPRLYGFTKDELRRFANDKSGRGSKSLTTTPPEERLWHAYGHVHHSFMSRPAHFKPAIEVFERELHKLLDDKFPIINGIGDEWTPNISIINLCKQEITACAITALFGPNILTLNNESGGHGFIDAFWEFDSHIFSLVLGFPRWMNPVPYKVRDRYLDMIQRYLDAGLDKFDFSAASEGGDSEDIGTAPAWEPCFGARISRELVRWLGDAGFQGRSIAGALGTLLFAQNSNTIPTATWMLIEILSDFHLLREIREEIATAYHHQHSSSAPRTSNNNNTHQSRTLDQQKLLTLPLLQSVFVETLRLHTDFHIMRSIEKPNATLNGISLAQGSLLLIPMRAAHFDQTIWGRAGDQIVSNPIPADKFYAERHIRYVPVQVQEDTEEDTEKQREEPTNPDSKTKKGTKKRIFSPTSRPNTFFPFGGGETICPGRHFAKSEILTMVAILIDSFDMEFQEWRKLDTSNSPSDRRAENDTRYSGAGVMPPDRDMVIRLRRRRRVH